MTSEIKNKTYNSVSDEIDKLKISKKEKRLSLIISFFTAILFIAGPVAICINCFIFTNFVAFFAFLIALNVIIALFIGDFLYLHLITKGKVLGLYHIWVIDILVLSMVVICIFLFILKVFF